MIQWTSFRHHSAGLFRLIATDCYYTAVQVWLAGNLCEDRFAFLSVQLVAVASYSRLPLPRPTDIAALATLQMQQQQPTQQQQYAGKLFLLIVLLLLPVLASYESMAY